VRNPESFRGKIPELLRCAAPPLAAPFRMRHDRGKSNNQAAIRVRRDKGGLR
jgi:hypothetical protein